MVRSTRVVSSKALGTDNKNSGKKDGASLTIQPKLANLLKVYFYHYSFTLLSQHILYIFNLSYLQFTAV